MPCLRCIDGPMPRSILFRQTMRLIQAVVHAEKNSLSDNQLISALEKAQEAKYSRRDVLKISTKAAALFPLTGLLLRETVASEKPLKKKTIAEPIVIVGAGMAGLTAAYRLQRAGIPVEIYEGSARLGGRVLTKDRFNDDGMFCELGAELIDSWHEDVLGLCKELRVPVEDLRPLDRGVEADLFHFGGKVYTQKEMIPAFRPLARHLARDIKAVYGDAEAFSPTFDNQGASPEVTRKFDNLSMHEYLYLKTDVDRWVLDAVNVLYICEYGMDSKEQSAINLLMLMQPNQSASGFNLLGDSDECFRVRGGNSRLIERLGAEVRKHAPDIHFKHKLVRISDEAGKIVLTFDADGGRKTVRAGRVVLGIPFTTLRKVDGIDDLGLSALKRRAIHELGYGVSTKLMLGFKDRYWRKKVGIVPANRANIVTDAIDQSFWETSKGQRGPSGIITNYTGGNGARDHRPMPARVETCLTELDSIYKGIKERHDGNVAMFDWGGYEFSQGSYVSPHPGQYTTLWGSPATPELSDRLYFTGEHTSVEGAGFINGGAHSGNQVASQILKRQRAFVTR